jgi:predicted nucleotidyltransferase
MQIDSKALFAGHPILKIRKLLRDARVWGFVVQTVEQSLNLNGEEAQSVINELEKQGYIQRDADYAQTSKWQNTIKGNALANASAAKPISRKTAEQRLEAFLERVQHVNNICEFVYTVEKVVLFGSYLQDTPTVSDIDLAIRLARKYGDSEQHMAACRERVRFAKEQGRYFSIFVEELGWPREEVLRFLKSRSRAISLHDLDTEEYWLSGADSKVIFEVGS